MEYQSGIDGFREICRIYGIARQSLKDWMRLHETFGLEGLKASKTGGTVIMTKGRKTVTRVNS
jgi:transposase-like protein